MTDAHLVGLVFVRVAAMVALLPSLGQVISLRVRFALAIVLTMLIAPLVVAQPPVVIGTKPWLDLAMEQLMWGAFVGGAIHVWVSSFALAGSWIAQISGWGVSETPVDGEEPTSALGQLHGWLGGIAFFAIDGPNMAIGALMNSFAAMPIVAGPDQANSIADMAATILSQSMWLALGVGSPVMTSLIASSIAVAAIQRALPHVNLVRFQMAGNWLVLLVAISLTMGLNVDHWSQKVAMLMHHLPHAPSLHESFP